MKSVISDNKIITFLPCYKRTSQLHETKVSDLKTVYGCNGYAVYDYIENEIFRTGNHSLYWCKNMLCRVADYWALSPEEVEKIVEYCIQVDLFNAELYTKYHILTSAEIRQQYNNAGFFMAVNS